MAELTTRLEALKKEIDAVKSLSIELRTNEKREKETLSEILQTMKDMGLDYKTIKDDIVNMERDIDLKVSEKEKEIKEVKETLIEIEKKVKLI